MSLALLKTVLYQKALGKISNSNVAELSRHEIPKIPTLDTPFDDDEKLCRVCCKEGHISFFRDLYKKTVADHINVCSEISVSSTDDFPKYLCRSCFRLLKSAVKFRKLSRSSTAKLIKIKLEERAELHRLSQPPPSVELVEVPIKYEPELTNSIRAESPPAPPSPAPSSPRDADDDRRWDDDIPNCPTCGDDFRDIIEYKHHIKTCRPPKKSKLKKPKDKKNLANGLQEHLCETCGKSLSSIYKLIHHRTTHVNVFPFKCTVCPYRGKTADLLRTHSKVHMAQKPYICAQCPSAFRTASNLKKHTQTHKGNEEPVPCPQCEKSLRNKDSLRSHIKSVHAPGPVLCNVCGKQFNTAKALSSHRSKVHNLRAEYTGRQPSYMRCQNEDLDTPSQENEQNSAES